jgi:hypothetical protein
MKLTVLTVLISLAAVLPASATDGASNEKKASSGSADSCCEADAEKPAGNKDSGKTEKKQPADSKTSSSADSAATPPAH